jgi:hypothetical protein
MKIVAATGSTLAGALALIGVLAVSSGAQAAVATIDLNNYDSTVNSPAGQTLVTMTVTDLSSGGVSVSYALDAPATFFASTGGGHITAAFNLDTTITAADITDTTPSSPGFSIVIPVTGVPGGTGSGFGDFTAGLQGDWTGTSNHFAGPITFDISGVSVADFVANSDGFFAVADALGNRGTGDIGGKGEMINPVIPVPEPSTWAMLLLGFAGLGFAGYRKAQGGRIAPTLA